MDAVDRLLLAELQADARLSYNELSRRVRLSSPAVAERVRRLESDGVITGYHAHVHPGRAGLAVMALVTMQCYGPLCILRAPEVAAWPEILQLHRVTGGACCVLMVGVADMTAFEQLIDRLAAHGQPASSMILSSPVPWRPLTA
ncbi:Lrp/AsnC family transcriptional regulator [Kitasatospora paracochleata]|uniref:Lrp/AsnC family leucine-responsive transcriptional regulator n=1 Tax=Kitasatospora paracochleata TaxID=58354 RepID=A0ABT1IZL4_9ACTN|nr:Lrp/AsnC family transcriptional regulator [Kitasatospora paracochleata]MCP2310596.1 Lrp/AsnC family leucine-responsive transcriptional regulator [Kitasatospora paracochleata]